MRLIDLIGADAMGENAGAKDGEREVVGLTADSRLVAPGYLFAALPGVRADGRDFIDQAIAKGAVAVLVPTGTPVAGGDVVVIEDDEPRARLARLAARFYGRQPAVVAAVTGTNGKTSIASFVRQIWSRLGYPAASLGTLGFETPGGVTPINMTTPDPVVLHALLADASDQGIDHAVLEASSHGIVQHRLDGVRFTAAAFTNLTHDHLDYHGSIEAYLDAKVDLFARVMPPGAYAVVNADSPHAEAVADAARRRPLAVLDYGRNASYLRLVSSKPFPQGQSLVLDIAGRRHEVTVALPGDFQASNIMAALALVLACGGPVDATLAALGHLCPVPGRLERVGATADGASVYVDYAHTPDALATVLDALRPHARGELSVVFGCGGDRDRAKRPLMGKIAAEKADHAIVTDDNPRGEDAAAIRRDILAGCPEAIEIGDRATAIRTGVERLGPGDVLVIAGKGHESGQIVGEDVIPFDDRQEARAALDTLAAAGMGRTA